MIPYHHTGIYLFTGILILNLAMGHVRANEIEYPGKDFAKLDTFEAVAVEDADKLFKQKDYRGAYAGYKAYTIEFPQGRALPYVLLRMGRCLHLSGKRNTAIKAYQDVVDYFPNDVRYAAAAMYYIGQCHAQNGNEDAALAAWAKLAKDKDYVGEPLSGTALIALAKAMSDRNNHEEATRYRWRTAVAFAKSNPKAAEDARSAVVHHYTVRSPNQNKLLEFCKEIDGFGWRQTIDNPQDSPVYWNYVLDRVLNARVEDAKRVEIARYWDSQMGDRFASDDALRVRWFTVRLLHDKDAQAWYQRMTTQFKSQPVTIERIRQWLPYFNRYPEARVAFFDEYAKPMLSSLDTKQQVALMNYLRHPMGMHEQAVALMNTIDTRNMDDAELKAFADFAAIYNDQDVVLRTTSRMNDKILAARTRFDFYSRRAERNGDYQQKALAEVPVLQKSPEHAQAIVWPHARLMHWQGKYDEAIKLYRSANRQPQSTWEIIACRLAMKQYDKAIELARELESVGGKTAAEACLKAADIYRLSGDKSREVQQLQLVLRRYPGSAESSTAHNRLENYGIKIIGGEAVAED